MKKIIAVKNIGHGMNNCMTCKRFFKQAWCDDIKKVYGDIGYSCSSSRTHFELIEDDNKMPELKAGMVVQLQDSNKYLLVMPKLGYDDRLILMDRIGNVSSILGHKYIAKLYHISRTSSYYTFFSGSHSKLELTLLWYKEPDIAAKVAELQEALNKLDKEHTESVEEIREQLRRLK